MEIIQKPWGYYKILNEDKEYLIKEIHVNPNSRFSLQYHNHRKETWFVVKGSGFVELGQNKEIQALNVNDIIKINIGQIHRMNAYQNGIVFIEIQQGDILDENDIVRLEDDYNRIFYIK